MRNVSDVSVTADFLSRQREMHEWGDHKRWYMWQRTKDQEEEEKITFICVTCKRQTLYFKWQLKRKKNIIFKENLYITLHYKHHDVWLFAKKNTQGKDDFVKFVQKKDEVCVVFPNYCGHLYTLHLSKSNKQETKCRKRGCCGYKGLLLAYQTHRKELSSVQTYDVILMQHNHYQQDI